jgi:CheY-like chemotaxis protein
MSGSRVQPIQKVHGIRKVMIVTPDSGCSMPDGLLAAVDSDVVFIEPVGRAYSQARSLAPQLVIMCLSDHDVAGCRLLSMLQLDPQTAHIPVVTCTVAEATGSMETESSDLRPTVRQAYA